MSKVQAILGTVVTAAVVLGAMGTAGAAGSQAVSETRAEFVVHLDQTLGITTARPAIPTFHDVPAANADYGYIEAAYQKGFINGIARGVFGPSLPITRAETAKILVEAYHGGNYTPSQISTSYTDNASVPAGLVGYVAEAAQFKLMLGFTNGSFAPKAYLTTAQESHLIAQLKVAEGQTTFTKGPITTNDAGATQYVAGSATTPVTVRLTDKDGSPLSGATLTLTAKETAAAGTWGIATAPGGQAKTTIALQTNAAGVADVYLTDTHAGDTGRVIASATGGAAASTGLITIVPSSPSQLVFTTQPLSEAPSDTSGTSPVTVQLEDAYGNATPALAGGVAVKLRTSSTQGAFALAPSSSGSVSSVPIPQGASSVNVFYGDDTVGTPTISTSSVGLQTAVQQEKIAAGTQEIDYTLSTVSVPSVTMTAGLNNIVLDAKVVDRSGNAVPGLTYSDFRVTSSDTAAGNQGVLGPVSVSAVRFQNGVYTLAVTDADADGGANQTLTVEVDGTALTQRASVTITPGAVAMYEVSPYPLVLSGNATSGSSPIAVTVTAVDAGGNPVPDTPVYLSFTAALGSSAGALVGSAPITSSPNAFMTNASGIVQVTYAPDVSHGLKGGSDVLTIANAPTTPTSAPTVDMIDTYTY